MSWIESLREIPMLADALMVGGVMVLVLSILRLNRAG